MKLGHVIVLFAVSGTQPVVGCSLSDAEKIDAAIGHAVARRPMVMVQSESASRGLPDSAQKKIRAYFRIEAPLSLAAFKARNPDCCRILPDVLGRYRPSYERERSGQTAATRIVIEGEVDYRDSAGILRQARRSVTIAIDDCGALAPAPQPRIQRDPSTPGEGPAPARPISRPTQRLGF